MSNDNFSRVITLFLANVTIANIATRLSITESAVEEVIREVVIDELLTPEPK
jgi:predicted transcriptional regulator